MDFDKRNEMIESSDSLSITGDLFDRNHELPMVKLLPPRQRKYTFSLNPAVMLAIYIASKSKTSTQFAPPLKFNFISTLETRTNH